MTISLRRAGAAGILAVAVLLLAACGSPDGPAGGATGSPSPPRSAPTPSPGSPAADPSGTGPTMTLHGTVGAGVEAGCTVLTSGDRVYELMGNDVRGLHGRTVTVQGYVVKGMLTICQQGTPFRVVQVESR
jgi:hypothetical protein